MKSLLILVESEPILAVMTQAATPSTIPTVAPNDLDAKVRTQPWKNIVKKEREKAKTAPLVLDNFSPGDPDGFFTQSL